MKERLLELVEAWEKRLEIYRQADKPHKEGKALWAKVERLRAESRKLRIEGRGLYAQASGMSARCNVFAKGGLELRVRISRLYAKGHELQAQAYKMRAEGDSLYAESLKMVGEATQLKWNADTKWYLAVVDAFAGKVRLKWEDDGSCHLSNGQVYPVGEGWVLPPVQRCEYG